MSKKYVLYSTGIGSYGSGFIAPDCNNKPNCSSGISSRGAFIFKSLKDAQNAQKRLLRSAVIIGLREAHRLSRLLWSAGTSFNTRKNRTQRRKAELNFFVKMESEQ